MVRSGARSLAAHQLGEKKVRSRHVGPLEKRQRGGPYSMGEAIQEDQQTVPAKKAFDGKKKLTHVGHGEDEDRRGLKCRSRFP